MVCAGMAFHPKNLSTHINGLVHKNNDEFPPVSAMRFFILQNQLYYTNCMQIDEDQLSAAISCTCEKQARVQWPVQLE